MARASWSWADYERQFGKRNTTDTATQDTERREGEGSCAEPASESGAGGRSPAQTAVQDSPEPPALPACRPGSDQCAWCRRATTMRILSSAIREGGHVRQRVICGCSLGRQWTRNIVAAASRRIADG